jgi:hypothetical protein
MKMTGQSISDMRHSTMVNDECYLVLIHTPLFTFVRPLVLLIFTNLTCFVCFVLIRSLHHKLTEGANGHEES